MAYREEEIIGREAERAAVRINVVGVGGCGNNIIDTLYKLGVPAKLIAMNTDAAVLHKTSAHKRVLLSSLTGLPRGAHGAPEVGAKAMEDSLVEAINAIDRDVDVVIGIAGLGGGTGTGGLPVLFRALGKERRGVLKIAIVTLPFTEEGEERVRNAQIGLQELLEASDAVIPNANDVLAEKVGSITMPYAFKMMDKKVARVVEALVRLQSPETGPGVINVDFSNIKRLFTHAGICFVGVGTGRRIYDAFTKALQDDYAESDLTNAHGAILYYEGREIYLDLTQIRNTVRHVSERFNISTVFFGIRPDWKMTEIRASVIATGVKSYYVDKFLGGA